jgi:uncharacterized ParB-like nuclease family protein
MSTCDKSVHSAGIQEIHVMPIKEIIRPIPSVLDESKVDSLVETLKVSSMQQPSAIFKIPDEITFTERLKLSTTD